MQWTTTPSPIFRLQDPPDSPLHPALSFFNPPPLAAARVLCSERPKARASTDGMGRAAAAGTGLLANVVAGVGSAIGASRTGTPAGDFFLVGGGGNSEGPKSTITDEAPLVQLYRRTDLAEEEGRAAPVAAATAGAAGDACTTTTTTTVAPDEGTAPVINSFYPHGGEYTGADGSGVGAGSSRSPPLAGPRGGNGRHASSGVSHAAAAAAGTVGEEATERRSALGMASATGGAVLRGLWGGVQSAAAAGAAVGFAGRQGAGAGDGGVAEPESTPAFRLYRREGDES